VRSVKGQRSVIPPWRGTGEEPGTINRVQRASRRPSQVLTAAARMSFIPAVCPMRTLQKAGFWCLLHERRNGLIENGSAGHRRSRHLRYCSERALSSGSPLSRLTCLCEDRTRSRRISKRQTIRIKPMVGQETTSGGRFDQVMNGEGALEPISILNTRAVLPPELLILAQSPFLCGVFGKSLYFSDLWSRPPGSNRRPAYYETIPGS